MDSSDLLNVLSDKLQNANKTVILQKKREREQIQEKLQNIETMFLTKKKFQSDALQKTKFSVDKVSTLTSETVKNLNLKSRKQQQLVRNLKQLVQNELENSERQHQEKTQQIVQRQTEKMTQIIDEFSKKAKNLSQANEKSLLELKRSINILQKDLQQQGDQRRNNSKQIQQDIASQVTKFNSMIQKERDHRTVSQQKIISMIQQIKNKINSQTQAISTKRKKNNAAILKLIEGACQRLEQKINIC